jgi:5-methylcytosine-specific restriction endonuclease McrA
MLLTILVSFGVGAFMGALVKCPHKASDAVDTIHKPRLTPLAITSHDLRLATFLDKKKAYLQSTQWRTKRSLALTRDGNACVICGISTHLNVHHLSYHQIPNEPIEELATLCEACHTHLHDTWGVPSNL